MTGPTRQEIIDAYEALETLCARVGEDTPVNAMRSLILTALPPKPLPTMAEVEWDDDKHYLAEAENDIGIRFLMLRKLNMGNIRCVTYPRFEERIIRTDALTPTGRRYELKVVQDD